MDLLKIEIPHTQSMAEKGREKQSSSTYHKHSKAESENGLVIFHDNYYNNTRLGYHL